MICIHIYIYIYIWEQSIKKLNFFFNLLLYLQLNQTCHLQSTPLHSWYTASNVFCISETRPGKCFAGRRKGPVSNFFLSPQPSEIGDIVVRISTSGTRKSLQGPNLESRAAGGQQSCFVKNSSIRSDTSADAAQILRQHDTSSVFRSKSGGTNFHRSLLLRQLHGQFGGDFDETQQALSQIDRRPLTWKDVQIWGRLRWTFCPIWNAGTTRDIAYGSNIPLHKPAAISEKSP